jgi:hypothetical protein
VVPNIPPNPDDADQTGTLLSAHGGVAETNVAFGEVRLGDVNAAHRFNSAR